MKAFITGSTGLVGSNLVEALVKQGAEVKALVRSRRKGEQAFSKLPQVTLVEGDMLDIPAFEHEMHDCDVLFHTAAYFREYYGNGDHWPKLEAINVKGTITLLDAAERAGVKKVIYVSSGGVLGRTKHGEIIDESTPPDQHVMNNLYFKSKWMAEQAVAEWLKSHHLPVVLILPAWIFGPGDSAPTSSGQIVLDFLARKLPGIIPGGTVTVDARDVAQAMIAAVERGRSGERYIVAGQYHTLGELCQMLEKASGVPAPTLRLPFAGALVFAWLSEVIARLRNTETLSTVAGLQTLQNRSVFSSAKAARELGISPRPLPDTLRDEVAWFRERGLAGAQATSTASSAAASSPAR
jgi:dihydroflavonol-4-reductase